MLFRSWLHSNAHPKGKKILAFEGFKHDQSPLNLIPDVIDELWVINNPSLYKSLKSGSELSNAKSAASETISFISWSILLNSSSSKPSFNRCF